MIQAAFSAPFTIRHRADQPAHQGLRLVKHELHRVAHGLCAVLLAQRYVAKPAGAAGGDLRAEVTSNQLRKPCVGEDEIHQGLIEAPLFI